MSDERAGYHVPLKTVLASIAALWGCYFVVATLRGWAIGMGLEIDLVLARLFIVFVSMAIFAALVPLVRILDRAGPALRVAAVLIGALPVALGLAAVNNIVFDHAVDAKKVRVDAKTTVKIRRNDGDGVRIDVVRDGGVLSDEEAGAETFDMKGPAGSEPTAAEERALFFKGLAEVAFGRYFLVLAWAAIYFALVKAEEARLAERREGEYRRAAFTAELRSLRYQVNPHFLFNTLNSLSALVMTGKPEQAEEMIQTLSTFYRRTLSSDPTSDVALSDEIELQKLYLAIEAVRFPKRLKTHIELPEELADAQVPGMILQPIVENSVKYGVAACDDPVTITICAHREGDDLVLAVCDDGPMTGAGDAPGCGIGLGNVRDRLQARFGERAGLTFGPKADGHFETRLTMPLKG